MSFNFNGAFTFFSYQAFVPPKHFGNDSFSFIRQNHSEPTQMLISFHVSDSGIVKKNLPFFKETTQLHAIQRRYTGFLAALDQTHHLKIAKVDNHARLIWKWRPIETKISKILKLFIDKEKQFHLLCLRDNREAKSAMFDRGVGEQSFVHISFNSQGRLLTQERFGLLDANRYIDALMYDNKIFVLTQVGKTQQLLVHNANYNTTQIQKLTAPYLTDGLFSFSHQLLLANKNLLHPLSESNRTFLALSTPVQSIETLLPISKNRFLSTGALKDGDLFLSCINDQGKQLWSHIYHSDGIGKNLSLSIDKDRIYWALSDTFPQKQKQMLLFTIDKKGKVYDAKAKNLTQHFFQELKKKLSAPIAKHLHLTASDIISLDYSYQVNRDKHAKKVQKALTTILTAFMQLLSEPRYKKALLRLSIQGHTSSEWKNTTENQAFLKNATLGYKRSYNLLALLIHITDKEPKYRFIKRFLSTNSLSSSQKVYDYGQHENPTRSRRNSILLEWKK